MKQRDRRGENPLYASIHVRNESNLVILLDVSWCRLSSAGSPAHSQTILQ